jgi:hypothetical protein
MKVNGTSDMVMSLVGLGTKNWLAGEDQQQFTGIDWLVTQWQVTPP